MGMLHFTPIDSVVVNRTLWVIFNPKRYRSKAAEAFSREILPQFAAPGWHIDMLKSSHASLAVNGLEVRASNFNESGH
ncbi:MAG: LysR family transcriptional regulator, partial [Rivularia sp. ALOHA_DT_140]|nr:LysR family transcriptional regulator [Rivularia sp. ALOHA_DT_140]